jgi:hypothetical protein
MAKVRPNLDVVVPDLVVHGRQGDHRQPLSGKPVDDLNVAAQRGVQAGEVVGEARHLADHVQQLRLQRLDLQRAPVTSHITLFTK